jgi:hypothetical protein
MPAPLRINHSTAAAVRAGRLDADQAAQLADMLIDAIDDPQAAAAALGLEHEHSRAEKLASIAAREAVVRKAAATMALGLSENARRRRSVSYFCDIGMVHGNATATSLNVQIS